MRPAALCLLIAGLSAQTAKQHFESGAAALRDGDLRAAEAAFLTVAKMEPRNVGAHGNLGVVYSRQGALDKAVASYERALRLAPADPALQTNLALVYLRQQRYADTVALLHETATPKAREIYATALIHTGAAHRALEILAPLPQSQGVLFALALAQLKTGRRAESLATFEKLDLAPGPLAFAKGKAFYEAALFEDALREFESVTQPLPGLALELGKTHVSLRNAGEAERHLRQAASEIPLDSETNYFLGALLVQNGKDAEALRHLAHSSEDFWGTHYYRGRALLALGRAGEAIAALEKARQANPAQTNIDYQLSRAYTAAGRIADSKAAAARYRESKSNERESLVLK